MKLRARIILFIFGFQIITFYSHSQKIVNLKFENISIKDGLSQSSPNCILQDSRGILWIGTEDGLNKYDGYHFTLYKPEKDNNSSISNNRIKCIYEDFTGNLWIGTNGTGVDMFDRARNSFTRIGLPDTKNLESGIITAIYTTSDGFLWIGSKSGLYKYNPKNRDFEAFLNEPLLANSISNDNVTCIAPDKTGFLWIGTEDGLNSMNTVTGIFKSYFSDETDENSLSGNSILSIFEDSQTLLWIGTENGLNVYNKTTDLFERIPVPDKISAGMQNYLITDMEEDNEGILWVSTFGGGIDLYVKKTGEFVNLQYNHNNPYCISSNEVLSLFKDNSGIMWAGSNGLDKYNPKKEKFDLYDYVPYSAENMVYRHIHSIYEDKSGILWIASKSDGVHIFDRYKKQSRRLIHEPGNDKSISSNKIRIIRETPEGTIWIGTDDNGLNKIKLDENRKPQKYTLYKYDPLNENTLTSNTIYSIHFENSNTAWIGTDNGVSKMDILTGEIKRYTPDPENPSGLNNPTAYYIFGDSKGRIWIATDKGLNRYNSENDGFDHFVYDEKNTNSLSSDEILTINEAYNGIFWIGTYAHGINSFDEKSGRFERYDDIEVLNTSVVYGILEDNSKKLWLSTNNGILHFNPVKRDFVQFSIEDGLQSNEFNGGAYYKSISGEMFFGGQYGFNAFFPENVRIDTVVPKLILTELKVNNISVLPGKDSPIKKHITEVKEIVFDYTENNFSLEFAALHFANPENNRYRYKLEGFDKSWIDAGAQRFVSYTRLPYKTFVFRLQASNNDGVWNNNGLSVKIKVLPPFWATFWFKLVSVILIISGIWYFIHNRLNAEEKQKEKLRKDIEKGAQDLEIIKVQLETQKEEITLQKQEIKLREKEQQDITWFNEGLNKFSDIMGKNRGNSLKMLQAVISELVHYVEAEQGGIFVLNDDIEDEACLELLSNYAYPEERLGSRFLVGEGYVGTCFKEKKVIEIDKPGKDYTTVRSGLGEDIPKHLVVIPLKVDEVIIGVIELSSFKKLKGYRISFIQKMAESLSSMISSEKSTEKMMKLVEQSKIQAHELSSQEEELRQNLEEMMATQEESNRREEDLINQAEEFASREVLMQEEIAALKAELSKLKEKKSGKKESAMN